MWPYAPQHLLPFTMLLYLILGADVARGQFSNCLTRTPDGGFTTVVLRWSFEGVASDILHLRYDAYTRTGSILQWIGLGFNPGVYSTTQGAMVGSDFVVARNGVIETYHRNVSTAQNGRPDPDLNAQNVSQLLVLGTGSSEAAFEFRKKTSAGPGEQNGVLFNSQQTLLIAWRNSTNTFDFHDGGFCYFTIDWTKSHDTTSCAPVGYSIPTCAPLGGSTIPPMVTGIPSTSTTPPITTSTTSTTTTKPVVSTTPPASTTTTTTTTSPSATTSTSPPLLTTPSPPASGKKKNNLTIIVVSVVVGLIVVVIVIAVVVFLMCRGDEKIASKTQSQSKYQVNL